MLYQLQKHKVFCAGDNFIAANAVLIGRVTIGRYSSVWFNTVIRGDVEDISIGESSNIQDNCVLHADPGYPLIIGNGVTIGHKVVLHGCQIADHSLIGIGSIILNNAQIGRNCLVGANTLITENTVIADGSLVVGSPGRVKRLLSKAEIAGLKKAAAGYVQNSQHFLQHLEQQ
jgi:carbonic anhydrase/acetyltransferase-like protein (isoleucine patch superfamily)